MVAFDLAHAQTSHFDRDGLQVWNVAVQERIELTEEHQLRPQKSKEVGYLAPALLVHQYNFTVKTRWHEVFERQLSNMTLDTPLKLVQQVLSDRHELPVVEGLGVVLQSLQVHSPYKQLVFNLLLDVLVVRGKIYQVSV